MKKSISKKTRWLLLGLQCLAAVCMAVCSVVIWDNARVTVNGITSSRSFMLPLLESAKSYEDSDLFQASFYTGVGDIVTLSVIQTQMETDGAFDGKKQIDIADYVNRKEKNISSRVSAKYYLEDLIKWNDYGFVCEPFPVDENGTVVTDFAYYQYLVLTGSLPNVAPSSAEDHSMDARKEAAMAKTEQNAAGNIMDKTQQEVLEDQKSTSSYVIKETPDETKETIATSGAAEVYADEGMDPDVTSYEITADLNNMILEERYQTAEGLSLFAYVSNWQEYAEITNMLRSASRQLAYNYRIYTQSGEAYSADNTNFRYLVKIPDGTGYQYYTNLAESTEILSTFSESELTKRFQDYGAYIYYYPEHMLYETNTGMEEHTIRDTLSSYSYAFPEACRIWIGVDTSYPVQDALWQGAQQYSFMPYYIVWVIALVSFAIAWLVLFIMLSFYEGRAEGEDVLSERQKLLRIPDHIPGEIMLLLALAFAVVYFCAVAELYYNIYWQFLDTNLMPVVVAMALVLNVGIMFFYLSLVRRLRAHVFWQNTVIGWLMRKLARFIARVWEKIKYVVGMLYNERDTSVQILVPYGFFLLVNLIAVLLLFSRSRFFVLLGLLGAAAFDVAAGVFLYKNAMVRKRIIAGIQTIKDGNLDYQLQTEELYGENLALAEAVNSIGEGIRVAVQTSMKDERLKTDLITNVSHDIKTPLTSIINYVDLIKREEIPSEKVRGYIEVLDAKSQRLKQLTEDLVEASKISSGNIEYQFETINFVELLHQTIGEFSEKFEEKQLHLICMLPEEPVPILADSRRIWRVMENLYNNIYKYALPGTRVYLDMEQVQEGEKTFAFLSLKNISAQPLNIQAEELTERFIRGDVSRSTEGSGLGLSIARNLTEAQKGTFTVYLDGDLFKVVLKFPLVTQIDLKEKAIG